MDEFNSVISQVEEDVVGGDGGGKLRGWVEKLWALWVIRT